MKKILFAALILSSTVQLFAQERLADPKVIYSQTITSAELKAHLKALASDAFEGRETGARGLQLAAEYIAGEFSELHLPQINTINGYFQNIPLEQSGFEKLSIKDKTHTYEFLKDFYAFPGSNNSLIMNTGEIIFLGYGIDDKKYSDYKNNDVRGKVIMIMNGEPNTNGTYLLTGTEKPSAWTTDWKLKLKTATQKGARCVLVIDKNFDDVIKNKSMTEYMQRNALSLKSEDETSAFTNSLFVSMQTAEKLCGSKAKKIEITISKINKRQQPVHFSAKNNLIINIEKNDIQVNADNILGYIEGSTLKNEVVVISAHYDHLGVRNGEIYNGADDDGSGTAALLEIAEAFADAKKAGHGPKRSILILAFAGEEKGLLGSEYYSEHPVFSLENTVCDLNIDMIGRIDDAHKTDSNYIYIIGSDFLSNDLHLINEYNANHYTNLKLDYTYNNTDDPNRFYYRSDHYNFAKNNIPVIFFFNGTHEDYHKPTDDVQKINFDLLTERCKLVFFDAWDIANRDEKLELNAK